MPRTKKAAGTAPEVRAAERQLMNWAASFASRDTVVRAARRVGVSKHRIHVLTGIARTTIDRIVGTDDAQD